MEFIRKSNIKHTPIIHIPTLEACVKGLGKRIRASHKNDRWKLEIIREEINQLIEDYEGT